MWQLHLLPEEESINMSLIHLLLGHVSNDKVLIETLINRPYCICHKATALLVLEWKQSLGGIIQKVNF